MSRANRAFALVELLVVIGLIAVLVSLLLPALSAARRSAERTRCLSNLRQLSQALVMYANNYRGRFPGTVPWCNASGSFICYLSPATLASHAGEGGARSPGQWQGWMGLGLLYGTKAIKDPRLFYCPSQTVGNLQWPRGWFLSNTYPLEDPNIDKWGGYSYRITGQLPRNQNLITQAELNDMKSWGLGRPKGIRAMAADVIAAPPGSNWLAPWPHVKPYGLNVAFSDGHAEFIEGTRRDYEFTARPPNNIDVPDLYMSLMFKAFDTRDFSLVRKTFYK